MSESKLHPYIQYKTPLVRERSESLCSTMIEVLNDMADYCEERKLPLVVTDSVSTEEEDKELKRVSDEHSQARAVDISLHGWLDLAINAFIIYFEQKFMSVAAIGKSSGLPRLIFRHVGTADHIHVQVARLYAIKDPLGLQAAKPVA